MRKIGSIEPIFYMVKSGCKSFETCSFADDAAFCPVIFEKSQH